MAPPPFKVVGDLPRPLTVRETAKTLRVSPQKLHETLEAIRSIRQSLERPLTGEARRALTKTAASAKAAKTGKSASRTAKQAKSAAPAGRQASKRPKSAAGSGR